MPKRNDGTRVSTDSGFNFDGAETVTVEESVTEILPSDDNKVDIGSPTKRFKNIYYASLNPDPSTGYLPLTGGTMSGGISLGGQYLANVSTLSGSGGVTRLADNVVSNNGASTSGNVASFSSATGKVVADSGVVAANVVTNSGGSVSGRLTSFSGTSGKAVTDSGVVAANVVTNAGFSGAGNIPIFVDGGGKILTDSAIASTNLVTNTAGATNTNQIATYSGTSGKLITNSTTPILGTPASGTLTNCTNLPISTGVSGLGAGVSTLLSTFNSANFRAAFPALEPNGTGAPVFDTSPNFTSARQKGQYLKVSNLTQYEPFTVGNTSTPTSFINLNSVGTRYFYQSAVNTGMCVKIKAYAQLNFFSGGGTLNICFYLNGVQNVALAVPAGTAAGSYLCVEFDCNLRAGTACRTQGCLLASGQYPVISEANGVFNKSVVNDVDVCFVFSIASASNQITPLSLTIETHYQT